MAIFYNKNDLFKLFESNPFVIDEMAEIFQYNYKNNFGYNILLFFSTYENKIDLILEQENFSEPLFNFYAKNVDRIVVNNDFKYFLIFKESEELPIVKCNFLSNFSIEVNT